MLTLNDGRSELWQWDTGRTLAVDADCSQVHFSNKVFGRSIDVDVVDGAAIIPDILLQTDKNLNVWAFVGTAENGYTKISKTYKVNRRNKPADYVFTPVEQTTIAEIAAIAQSVRDDANAGLFDGEAGATPNIQIGTVETLPAGSSATASMTGTAENPLLNLGIPQGVPGSGGGGSGGTSDHSKLSNRDAVDQHPIGAITGLQDELDAKQPSGNYLTSETDPTVPAWAKAETKPTYTAKEVGALPNTTVIPAKTSDLLNDSGFITGVSIQTISADESDDVIAHLNQGLYFFEPRPIQGINFGTGLAMGISASGLVSVDDEQGLDIYNAGCYAWYDTNDSTWYIEESYTLPVATENTLGGVMPVAKTDDMSQTVGVDGEGRLWTAPVSGGGGSTSASEEMVVETYTITELPAGRTAIVSGLSKYKKFMMQWVFKDTSASAASNCYMCFNEQSSDYVIYSLGYGTAWKQYACVVVENYENSALMISGADGSSERGTMYYPQAFSAPIDKFGPRWLDSAITTIDGTITIYGVLKDTSVLEGV